MGQELEWKLTVPEPGLLEQIEAWPPLRALMAEAPRDYRMQTSYYDAPDRRFSARHITLRRRLENQRSVICVKAPMPSPAHPNLRGEWELEGEDLAAALPQLIARGAPAELAEAPALRCVAGAEFRRRAVLLRFADGSACELALDRGRLFGPTVSAPLCELELELKQGEADAALQLCRTLALQFGLQPQPKSKYARARLLD